MIILKLPTQFWLKFYSWIAWLINEGSSRIFMGLSRFIGVHVWPLRGENLLKSLLSMEVPMPLDHLVFCVGWLWRGWFYLNSKVVTVSNTEIQVLCFGVRPEHHSSRAVCFIPTLLALLDVLALQKLHNNAKDAIIEFHCS